MTGIIEQKTLTEYVSCECNCKFDGRKYNSNQKWNNHKCLKSKNILRMQKRLYLEFCYMRLCKQ